jgi:TrmH family RNA methyltransferase
VIPALGDTHPRLASARALLAVKGRRRQNRFLIEGPTLLAEAAAAGVCVEEVFATPAALARYPGLPAFRDGPLFEISEWSLKKLSDVEAPTGVVATARIDLRTIAEILAGPEPVLLLASIGDPGNVGTLIRSAEFFGVRRIIVGTGTADPFSPKVVRAAMGALFRVAAATGGPAELAEAAAREARPLIATGTSGDPLHGFPFPERAIIAIGSERQGLGHWPLGWSSQVTIPRFGGGESLNAGVAGSIVFYELTRKNRSGEP